MSSHLLRRSIALLPTFALVPTLAAATIDDGHIQHVLLISVDGMHAVDAAKFIAANPNSTLAQLSATAVTYANANTSRPSDSFPGLASLVTGGLPQDTGLWYDDAWDRSLYQPACTFPTLDGGSHPLSGNNPAPPPPTPLAPGIECVLTELIDYDCSRIDAGASLLPAGAVPLNRSYLPRDASMRPVYPHQILRVNTIFEVAHQAGLRTAWSDKHAAYEWVNGPSGLGVDDFFVREVNASLEADGVTPLPFGGPTNGVEACSDYDNRKVTAIINQINGLDSSGVNTVGTPAIFGMNFQSVSVGEKVSVDGQAQGGAFDPNSNPDAIAACPPAKGVTGVYGTRGGYMDATGTPTPVLTYAMNFVDQSLGKMVTALKAKGLYNSTLIIITAKHGQSPIDISTLRMKHAVSVNTNTPVHDPTDSLTGGGIAPGAAAPPAGFVQPVPNTPPAAIPAGFTQTDTIGLVWFQDNLSGIPAGGGLSTNVANGVQVVLNDANAANNPDAIDGLLYGQSLIARFDDPTKDPRTPDIIILPVPGTIYSGSAYKYMEHGGFGPDDCQVAMIISNPSISPATITKPVFTTAVAPTIVKSLGLDPNALQAVQKEGTPVLEGLGIDGSSPPQAITDLTAMAGPAAASQVTLFWTTPADAGSPTGAPSSYDIRWSSAPITQDTWNGATSVGQGPAPGAAGSSASVVVSGLAASSTLYFAARSLDARGQASTMSNDASTATSAPGNGSSSSSSHCGSGVFGGLFMLSSMWLVLRRRARKG